jgi:hypothetical protein
MGLLTGPDRLTDHPFLEGSKAALAVTKAAISCLSFFRLAGHTLYLCRPVFIYSANDIYAPGKMSHS